jgi:hypothetical protein
LSLQRFERFVCVNTAALECSDHWWATVVIVGNMVRVRFQMDRCEVLTQVMVDMVVHLADATQQHLKIELSSVEEDRLLDGFVPVVDLLSPVQGSECSTS